jgi:hypothetical protein
MATDREPWCVMKQSLLIRPNNENIDRVWQVVCEHFFLLSNICRNFCIDLFNQIFQSLLHFMTHRQFFIHASKSTEMLAITSRHCILDCCVYTEKEFVEQICHLIGWSFPNPSKQPYEIGPLCDYQIHRFIDMPYRNVIHLFIRW